MPRVVLAALLLLALPLALPAAERNPPLFETDVLPIFNNHCLQCHGGVHQRNGLDLRTLAGVLKGGKSGPAVVVGNVEDSLLWKKLSVDSMPKTDNKVSPENKAMIREWIESGAKGSAKSEAIVASRASAPAEVATRIDAEIAAKLAAAKVPASPRMTRSSCAALTSTSVESSRRRRKPLRFLRIARRTNGRGSSTSCLLRPSMVSRSPQSG